MPTYPELLLLIPVVVDNSEEAGHSLAQTLDLRVLAKNRRFSQESFFASLTHISTMRRRPPLSVVGVSNETKKEEGNSQETRNMDADMIEQTVQHVHFFKKKSMSLGGVAKRKILFYALLLWQ